MTDDQKDLIESLLSRGFIIFYCLGWAIVIGALLVFKALDLSIEAPPSGPSLCETVQVKTDQGLPALCIEHCRGEFSNITPGSCPNKEPNK